MFGYARLRSKTPLLLLQAMLTGLSRKPIIRDNAMIMNTCVWYTEQSHKRK